MVADAEHGRAGAPAESDFDRGDVPPRAAGAQGVVQQGDDGLADELRIEREGERRGGEVGDDDVLGRIDHEEIDRLAHEVTEIGGAAEDGEGTGLELGAGEELLDDVGETGGLGADAGEVTQRVFEGEQA
jgi:hypothetical protein